VAARLDSQTAAVGGQPCRCTPAFGSHALNRVAELIGAVAGFDLLGKRRGHRRFEVRWLDGGHNVPRGTIVTGRSDKGKKSVVSC